jgi:hypothetical protein
MKEYLVIAYGSLLNEDDRHKDGIIVNDKGATKLIGYRFSFDYWSKNRRGGVLNLQKTNNTTDHLYAKIYSMGCESYANVLDRELRKDRTSNYVEVKIGTKFGLASMFIIPEEKIRLTEASDSYVEIVEIGLNENFSGEELQHNLLILKEAVALSHSSQKGQ